MQTTGPDYYFSIQSTGPDYYFSIQTTGPDYYFFNQLQVQIITFPYKVQDQIITFLYKLQDQIITFLCKLQWFSGNPNNPVVLRFHWSLRYSADRRCSIIHVGLVEKIDVNYLRTSRSVELKRKSVNGCKHHGSARNERSRYK